MQSSRIDPSSRPTRTDVAGRLHVAIGPSCNNNCIFCMEEDRVGRMRTNGGLSADHVRGILESSRGTEEVCFTSGEPTLVAALPQYVRWARELGYPRISVTTNGRRLAYASYVAQLAAAGVNLFYISIHGHTAKLHDGLARTPGAFDQAVQGLANVARIKRRGVSIHTSTVLTTRNIDHLPAIYCFLRARGADQVVFNAPQANGRAHTHFERIFPRYSAMVDRFAALLQSLDTPEAPTYLVDVPLCLTERLPDRNRGWVEAYVHHEPTPDPTAPASTLVEKSRADFDSERRLKREECMHCCYERHCAGVWGNYLRRYGWDEMRPAPIPTKTG